MIDQARQRKKKKKKSRMVTKTTGAVVGNLGTQKRL